MIGKGSEVVSESLSRFYVLSKWSKESAKRILVNTNVLVDWSLVTSVNSDYARSKNGIYGDSRRTLFIMFQMVIDLNVKSDFSFDWSPLALFRLRL